LDHHLDKTRIPILHMTPRALIMTVCWIGAIIGFVYYLYYIILQLRTAMSQPSTNVQYSFANTKAFPAVTICNWNTEGTPQQQGFPAPCDFCTVSFDGCVIGGNPCNETLFPEFVTYNTSTLGIFYCYQFNNLADNIINASDTGYLGSISFNFFVVKPPRDPLARTGLQVTFHAQGDIPDVVNEINYAAPYNDNLFALREIDTVFLSGTDAKTWDVTIGQLQLSDFGNNSLLVPVTVTITYQTLATQTVTEVLTYTVFSFLGDISGMVGLLMGLDVLKFTRGLLAISKSVARKSAKPVIDVFNG